MNPWRALRGKEAAHVDRLAQHALESQQRYEKLLLQYKALLEDARYKDLAAELEASLGEQIVQLVHQAESCAHCAPCAVRVKMLHEVLRRPLEQLFIEAQRTRLPEME